MSFCLRAPLSRTFIRRSWWRYLVIEELKLVKIFDTTEELKLVEIFGNRGAKGGRDIWYILDQKLVELS